MPGAGPSWSWLHGSGLTLFSSTFGTPEARTATRSAGSLRALPGLENVCLIALTTRLAPSTRPGQEAGIHVYLPRPFQQSTFAISWSAARKRGRPVQLISRQLDDEWQKSVKLGKGLCKTWEAPRPISSSVP